MPSDKRQRQREGRLARQEELRLAQQKSKKRRQYIFGAIAVVLLGGVFYLVTKNGGSASAAKKATPTTASSATSSTAAPSSTAAGATTTVAPASAAVPVIPAPAGVACPNLDGSSPHYTRFTAAPGNCIDPTKTYTATIGTDAGNIVLALNPADAPKTVNNFVFLSGYHFYDGIIFHRVIPGFMDQGGDPLGTGSGGPGYMFADELPKAGVTYKSGALAMANSGPNTNGSQFFIVATDAQGAGLQPNYSLFGQVTSGMDIVLKINNDGTSGGTPNVVHKISKVTIAVS